MAEHVYIFGAGASVSAGAPVMLNFVSRAAQLLKSRARYITTPEFERFFRVVNGQLQQLRIKAALETEDLEVVCGLLEMSQLVGRLPGTDDAQTEALVSTLKTVLRETIQFSVGFEFNQQAGHFEPPGDYYRLVVGDGTLNDPRRRASRAFITFNYDLALDYALHFASVGIDYGVCAPASVDALPLLKLHGSLNWARCPDCLRISVVDLGRVFNAENGKVGNSGELKMFLRPEVLFGSLGTCSCGSTRQRETGIAPPSWNKGQHHDSYRAAWRRAALELSEAEHIYIIGYSMPPTDLFFRDLLAVGLAGPTRLERIHVVNINGSAEGRIKEVLSEPFRRRVSLVQSDFSSWVASHAIT